MFADIALNIVETAQAVVEQLEAEGQADEDEAEQQNRSEADLFHIRPHRLARQGGEVEDTNGGGVDLLRDTGLVEARGDAVENVALRLDLA